MICKDLVIIGGGPAGMAAALAAYEKDITDILLLERDKTLGGILNQCIHDGFGLHYFKERLTGPEYADRFIERMKNTQIDIRLQTMVTEVTKDLIVTAVNETGVLCIQAKAIVLAMGCRERPRGALNIPGTRPAGVYSAGTVQKLVNQEGKFPGKNVVILGSGDIGLIMARRLALEGAHIHGVLEIMPYSSGLVRNIVQCLDDFCIPLKLGYTVTKILGEKRVEGVVISQVDERLKPVPGTEETIPCDTLVLSVGLIPENDILEATGLVMDPATSGPVTDNDFMTDIPGLFSCGNCLHVHDLVDYVTLESTIAGEKAAEYILHGDKAPKSRISVLTGGFVRYVIPRFINKEATPLTLMFRVTKPIGSCTINLIQDQKVLLFRKKNRCTPGEMEKLIINKTVMEQILQNGSPITIEIEKK